MKRLDELYAANGQVGFRWYKRIDSNVMVAEAIQVIRQAAA
jgi:predicted phage gp36 major capsid-like protein